MIAYGLAGRLVPGILELNRSFVAGGRLEQPLTYWNAEGLLAAMGFLLCVRLAGDPSASRAAAAGGRGRLRAAGDGRLPLLLARRAGGGRDRVIVLLAAAPRRAAAAGRAHRAGRGAGRRRLVGRVPRGRGPGGQRAPSSERDGAIVLAGLLALMLAAALISARAATRSSGGTAPAAALRAPPARRWPLAAVLACAVGLVVGGLIEDIDRSASAEARPSRFASVSSLRYEYWRVGGEAFCERAAHRQRGRAASG